MIERPFLSKRSLLFYTISKCYHHLLLVCYVFILLCFLEFWIKKIQCNNVLTKKCSGRFVSHVLTTYYLYSKVIQVGDNSEIKKHSNENIIIICFVIFHAIIIWLSVVCVYIYVFSSPNIHLLKLFSYGQVTKNYNILHFL